MAEAVGLAASIVALVELTFKVVNYLRDVEDAPKECLRLMLEVKSVEGILAALRGVVETLEEATRDDKAELDENWSATIRALNSDNKEGPLAQLEALLNDIISAIKKVAKATGLKKLGRRMLWPFKQEEVQKWLSAMERQKSTLLLALQNDHIALSRAIFKTAQDTREAVQRLDRRQDKQEQRHDEKDRQKILSWLSPIDHASAHQDLIGHRLAGTGQWLLDSPEFQGWLSRKKRISTLYCPGIPGAGKSVIAASMVDYLQSLFYRDMTVGVVYIYYRYDRPHEQQPPELFLSLSRQLAEKQPSLPDEVKKGYEQREQIGRPSDVKSSTHLLRSIVQQYGRIFFVIDALDECQNQDDRETLLDEIFALEQYAEQSQVYVFATSRVDPSISGYEHFTSESSVTKPIDAQPEDILRYVNERMTKFKFKFRGGQHQHLQEEIRQKVVNSAAGMFLLVQLHVDSLATKRTVGAIKDALRIMDRGTVGLSKQYDAAMERINSQDIDSRELAIRVLSWVMRAKRSLTAEELRHVLAISKGDREFKEDYLLSIEDLTPVCAGLVTIDQQGGIIRWIHYTTKDYFTETWQKWFPDSEQFIATTCITYLSFDKFESGGCPTHEALRERLCSTPLYHYAAKHWAEHIPTDMASSALVLDFLAKKGQVEAAGQALLVDEADAERVLYISHNMSAMHLGAYFGLHEAVKAILILGYKPDSKDSSGRTPLFYAVEKGHLDTVKLLLGAHVRVDPKSSEQRTPLSFAAENGHTEVVRLLLQKGANPDSEYVRNVHRFRTPLSYAAGSGHPEVVRMLLEKGASVKADDIMNRTPLSYAVQKGNEAVINLLLDLGGADADTRAHNGTSALSYAAAAGNVALVKLLLDRGADPETFSIFDGNNMGSPLLDAVQGGHTAVVELLISTGRVYTDPSEDWYGQRALSYAAERGYKDIVLILLKSRDVDVDSRSHEGRTPMSFAAASGREDIVRIFLETSGINPDNQDWVGRAPLSYAAENGHEGVVRLLLRSPNVNPEGKDKEGKTALSWAFKGGHQAVVNLLLADDRVDLESTDSRGLTQLAQAARDGNTPAVQLLLKTGAVNADSRDSDGRTPLLHAARKGRIDVIKLLYETGRVDVNAVDAKGRTPLLCAAKKGHGDIVELLLDICNGSTVDSADKEGRTPLSYAAGNDHGAIVTLLLDTGHVEPEREDVNGRTPLSHATEHGTVAVVKTMLEQNGVDLDYLDNDGRSALWWAIWGEGEKKEYAWSWLFGDGEDENTVGDTPVSHELLELLLSQPNVQVNTVDSAGQTPFMLAVKNGLKVVMNVLLADSRVDPDFKAADGRTPLWWAVKNNNKGITKLLLEDSRVHLESQERWTPLWWAAQNGHEDIVRLVLAKDGVDPNLKDEDGRTAISHAAEKDHREVVALLLSDQRVGPDSADKDGNTPVWWAVEQYHGEIVELLLADNRVNPNSKEGWTPLWWAAEFGTDIVVRLLLAREDIDPDLKDKDGRTALSYAAGWGSEAVAELLLDDHRVDPDSRDEDGLSPLFWAIKRIQDGSWRTKSCKSIIKRLLSIKSVSLKYNGQKSWDHWMSEPLLVWAAQQSDETIFSSMLARNEVDANLESKWGRTALLHAARDGKQGVVKALLDLPELKVDSKDEWGRTSLSYAAEAGHTAIVELLLKSGKVDVNSTDSEGKTPLSYAAPNRADYRRDSSEEMVKLLLSAGADCNSKDNTGRTPFSYAVCGQDGEVVRLWLKSSGVDVDSKDFKGRTPLSHAAESWSDEVAKMLLDDFRVDRNSKDIDGRTPLSHAVMQWSDKVATLLLKTDGVDVDSKDSRGRTPLSHAAERGRKEVVRLLLADPRVNPESKDDDGLTPLSYARHQHHDRIVKLLLAKTGNVDTKAWETDSNQASSSSSSTDDESSRPSSRSGPRLTPYLERDEVVVIDEDDEAGEDTKTDDD